MPTLIEGLKIEIGSTELIGHLTGRAAYHRDKAGMYQGQVEVLLKAGERPRRPAPTWFPSVLALMRSTRQR